MDKRIARYTKVYGKAAAHAGISGKDAIVASFAGRLEDMYASELFRTHNVYPTINVEHVYAVIAMCLELREHRLTDEQIFDALNCAFAGRQRFFGVILGAINLLPNSYAIAKRWNISDHEKRVADGSIDYDLFEVRDHSIEYRISGCRYVDMFKAWGIRPLCKVFCETDTRSYASLTRRVGFVRHSDLSDGPSCHDEIFEKGSRQEAAS
jgi:hypothetical protein